MVHRLVVGYGRPQDAGAFDACDRDTRTPLATHVEVQEARQA